MDDGKRSHPCPVPREIPTVLGILSLPCDYLVVCHVAQHPKGFACAPQRANAAQVPFNPDVVKHLVLDLP